MNTAKQLIAKMLSSEKAMDEAFFSNKLFDLYYELSQLVGDAEIVTELLRTVPEKILLPILNNMKSRVSGSNE